MSGRNQNIEPIEVVEVVEVIKVAEQAKREFTLEDYREVIKRGFDSKKQANSEFTLKDYLEVLKREMQPYAEESAATRLESVIRTGGGLDGIGQELNLLRYRAGVFAGLQLAMRLTTSSPYYPTVKEPETSDKNRAHPVKEGLTPGRIVHYVLPDGNHRAAIVVDVAHPGDDVSLTMVSQGLVTLSVFFLEEDKKTSHADRDGYIRCFFSDNFQHGTWHWIEKA